MITTDDERDVAAALLVAIEAGLLTTADAIRVVDREMLACESPPGWLIAASLAEEPEDLMHALRDGAGDHPMLAEVWALLEAMDRALARGANAMEVASRIERVYPYGEWPRDLSQALYNVYEETTCAHNHGGVPQPKYVEQALCELLSVARGRSAWRALLQRVSTIGSDGPAEQGVEADEA